VTQARKLDRRHALVSISALFLTANYCARRDQPSQPPARPDGVPVSAFNSSSTAEEVTRGLDLTGKTAMVTGATSGLGLETLRVLALRGAHVVATGRTRQRAAEACATVAAGRSTPVAMDLENWDSVVAAAGTIAALGRPLDILICNAGIMAPPALRLVNGVEQQFAVNHLGHFVLCHHLLGPLRAANQGRVVVVSSWLYSMAPPSGIDFENLDGSRGYDPQQAYGQSKLANALFAFELARRLSDSRVTANALHPGVSNTNLDRSNPAWRRVGARLIAWNRPWVKSVEEAAATQAYLATAPGLATVTGQYFQDCNPVIPTGRHVRDQELAARLWATSEELTRRHLL
jgi:NAD(P)-dependent dehydrogenase (short-subunit alcohol dehydrogenase family)